MEYMQSKRRYGGTVIVCGRENEREGEMKRESKVKIECEEKC